MELWIKVYRKNIKGPPSKNRVKTWWFGLHFFLNRSDLGIANRMDIATYDGIITVKYVQSKTSSDVFHREDPFRDTIDKNNCYYLRTSCSRGKKRLECKNHKKISPAQKDWG